MDIQLPEHLQGVHRGSTMAPCAPQPTTEKDFVCEMKSHVCNKKEKKSLHGGTHTQAQLSDLAGNMFSSSVSLAVDIAVLCAIECEQMNGDAAMDTTTQLCRLLHMCGDSLEMTDDADEFVL